MAKQMKRNTAKKVVTWSRVLFGSNTSVYIYVDNQFVRVHRDLDTKNVKKFCSALQTVLNAGLTDHELCQLKDLF